jgi:hypothetical protein
MRGRGGRAVVVLLLLASGMLPRPVLAQADARISQACRQSCTIQNPGQDPTSRPWQACVLRCAAGERHLQQQHRTGTAEATGRGRTAASSTMGSTEGVGMATTGTGARTIAAYAATAPGRGVALSEPMADRLAAHRAAEQACFGRNGTAPCRSLGETRDRCAAIVMGVRAVGVMITSDPNTYSVQYYAFGSGPDPRTAEGTAMSECAMRSRPDLSCRVALARCTN